MNYAQGQLSINREISPASHFEFHLPYLFPGAFNCRGIRLQLVQLVDVVGVGRRGTAPAAGSKPVASWPVELKAHSSPFTAQ